jgi:hypothetical protein
MDVYTDTLNSIGDVIIRLADPTGEYTGYTKVSDKSTHERFCMSLSSISLFLYGRDGP